MSAPEDNKLSSRDAGRIDRIASLISTARRCLENKVNKPTILQIIMEGMATIDYIRAGADMIRINLGQLDDGVNVMTRLGLKKDQYGIGNRGLSIIIDKLAITSVTVDGLQDLLIRVNKSDMPEKILLHCQKTITSMIWMSETASFADSVSISGYIDGLQSQINIAHCNLRWVVLTSLCKKTLPLVIIHIK